MTSRPKRGANLFEAAGLEQDAPRPLADRLRPTKLSEVVGQDHLLGPDGALTRMLATRSLGSRASLADKAGPERDVFARDCRGAVCLLCLGFGLNKSKPVRQHGDEA